MRLDHPALNAGAQNPAAPVQISQPTDSPDIKNPIAPVKKGISSENINLKDPALVMPVKNFPVSPLSPKENFDEESVEAPSHSVEELKVDLEHRDGERQGQVNDHLMAKAPNSLDEQAKNQKCPE